MKIFNKVKPRFVGVKILAKKKKQNYANFVLKF